MLHLSHASTNRCPQGHADTTLQAVICVVPFREWANDFARYSTPFLPEM
ncbi:hypothetical protein [Enterobacter roggenkampii]|nr:hypothetical protein [Enterobacter roggenkampii]